MPNANTVVSYSLDFYCEDLNALHHKRIDKTNGL